VGDPAAKNKLIVSPFSDANIRNMPVPNYFAPKPKPIKLSEVTGGMNASEIRFEIQRGARFIVFQYVISAVVITVRRNSKIQFIKAGENPTVKSLPYTGLTLLCGWWGFPWGFIYTPQAIYKNLRGGTDITPSIQAKLDTTNS
jgi:hypothetical protein